MLEEKLEALTTEVVALRKAVEANTAGGGATSGATEDAKPAAKKTTAKKTTAKKAVKPKHDADEVASVMRTAAKQGADDKAAIQGYIAEQDCEDLAELLTKPELFDAAHEFAEGLIGGDEEEEEDI